MLIGFAMAFSVALPEESSLKWLFLMITSGLYAHSNILDEFPMNNPGQVLLFQMLMFWAMLIMLNLLIGSSAAKPIMLRREREKKSVSSTLFNAIATDCRSRSYHEFRLRVRS